MGWGLSLSLVLFIISSAPVKLSRLNKGAKMLRWKASRRSIRSLDISRVLDPQQCPQLGFGIANQDGAMDRKSGCDLVAARPGPYAFGRCPVVHDVDLLVVDMVGPEELARPPAVRAPRRAVHHHCCLRLIDLSGCGRLWLYVGSSQLGLDFGKHPEQFLVIRLFVDVVYVHIADHALFVDHEDRPFAVPLRTQYSVKLGYFPMWIKIT
jgi:hypothetical protein